MSVARPTSTPRTIPPTAPGDRPGDSEFWAALVLLGEGVGAGGDRGAGVLYVN